jgi:hypothetical protein
VAHRDRRTAADEEVTKGDQTVERAADKLETLAHKAAAEGGVKAKLAGELAEDAAFVRKLKPSLMVARARGQAPKDQPPGAAPVSPTGPQLGSRPAPRSKPAGAGPNPFVVVGAAFAIGIALAKWIDWRGSAHPRN